MVNIINIIKFSMCLLRISQLTPGMILLDLRPPNEPFQFPLVVVEHHLLLVDDADRLLILGLVLMLSKLGLPVHFELLYLPANGLELLHELSQQELLLQSQ